MSEQRFGEPVAELSYGLPLSPNGRRFGRAAWSVAGKRADQGWRVLVLAGGVELLLEPGSARRLADELVAVAAACERPGEPLEGAAAR